MQVKYSPRDLSGFDKKKKYVIVFTEWNEKYVNVLVESCNNTLKEKWILNIDYIKVPWTLELTYWALKAFDAWADIVIAIWTVIRGDTSHYDHVCDWVIQWITNLQIKHWKPIIFGVLTCDNKEQVKERLSKWEEWALSAIQVSKLG